MSTRRKLLKGAGLAAVAGMTFGKAGPAAAVDAGTVAHWHHEVDVVCVGGGAASLTAAAFAAAGGKQTLVLEKGPVLGGTTAKSGAVFWIPDHFLLRAKGIRDEKRSALEYMCRYSFPERYDAGSETLGLDPAAFRLIEAFYDNGSVMVDDLRRMGALQVMQFNSAFDGEDPLDYLSHVAENRTPRGRPLCPQLPDGSQGGGPDLIGQLESFLEARNVPILTDHRVIRMVMQHGAVVGVEAEFDGRQVFVRARQACIFGTGGYANSVELVREYLEPFHYGSCASVLATGDLVGMAQSAGARLANMSGGWRTPVVFEEAVRNRALATGAFMQPGDSMFVVNKYGRRIANEKRNYNDRTRVHLSFDPNSGEHPNLLSFYIYDRRTAEAYAGNYPLPASGEPAWYTISGNTLEELAANIASRLDKYASVTGGVTLAPDFRTQLKTTLARFNDFARSGKDEDFGRGDYDYDRQWMGFFGPMRNDTEWQRGDGPNPTMHPLQEQGPYHCVILAPGLLDTNGGPAINDKAQMLDGRHRPIPGLYGAGNCVASPSRSAYYGAGGTLGLAMTFGYIAAMNAIQEPVRSA
jgi:3-oxosteroid 1-dehydrogenase